MSDETLTAAKHNTRGRLEYQFNEKLARGTTLSLGFDKELDLESLGLMSVQYDVLSLDPANDADGYTIVSIDGTVNSGISKTQYEGAVLELKVAGLLLWKEWKTLEGQIEGAETVEFLDGLQFS